MKTEFYVKQNAKRSIFWGRT